MGLFSKFKEVFKKEEKKDLEVYDKGLEKTRKEFVSEISVLGHKFHKVTDEYFEDHFAWEQQLAMQIKNVIERLGKNFEYDFLRDSINISFAQKEVDFILSNYRDEKVKNIMDHFTSLLSDWICLHEFKCTFFVFLFPT